MKKGLAEGLSYTGLQMQDIRRRLLFTEESHDTLRARVAKLEAALRDIADNPEPMSAAIAHAALGAGKETP